MIKLLPLAFSVLLCVTSAALADPEIGKPAPDFTATDTNGKPVSLAALKGKEVVLEWTSNECPFVKKWYNSGSMQKLQAEATKMGIVWISIISSAPGNQGFVTAEEANKNMQEWHATPTSLILDPNGSIGHSYGAMTTPHIFVIGKDGKLDYKGGADSIASTDPDDIAKAEPYAREAFTEVADGKTVTHPITKPYGCNVKY